MYHNPNDPNDIMVGLMYHNPNDPNAIMVGLVYHNPNDPTPAATSGPNREVIENQGRVDAQRKALLEMPKGDWMRRPTPNPDPHALSNVVF